MWFRDRRHAGRVLAAKLVELAGRTNLVVLALPRGGVPVGYEVARALGAPLDVFLVRKLGLPGHEELAMGALASGGVRVLNEEIIAELGVDRSSIEKVAGEQLRELERRERAYRGGRAPLDVCNKTVVVVDDGLATGASMRAAVVALRRLGAGEVITAVPIASPSTCDEMREVADLSICALTPEPFHAVGLWYRDFSQTTDDEVRQLLGGAQSDLRAQQGLS
jgi:putative phosphoribosyl transferase